MKRTKMIFNERRLGKMSGTPNLKVGILSDVQGYAYKGDWGMHNCENVLKFLAESRWM